MPVSLCLSRRDWKAHLEMAYLLLPFSKALPKNVCLHSWSFFFFFHLMSLVQHVYITISLANIVYDENAKGVTFVSNSIIQTRQSAKKMLDDKCPGADL